MKHPKLAVGASSGDSGPEDEMRGCKCELQLWPADAADWPLAAEKGTCLPGSRSKWGRGTRIKEVDPMAWLGWRTPGAGVCQGTWDLSQNRGKIQMSSCQSEEDIH